MSRGAIPVAVDVVGIPQVRKAYENIRTSIVTQLVKSGSVKGARQTIPTVKAKLQKHKRTGQLIRSEGVKYKGYKNAWVTLLGQRRYFRGSAPSWMSPNATTIDPNKYAHLLEGGRGHTTRPDTAFSMPIFVRKLQPRLRKRTTKSRIPWRHARRFAKDRMTQYGYRRRQRNGVVRQIQDVARRVPGGWLLFSMYARPAPAYPFLDPAAPAYGQNIKNAVAQEVISRLPTVVARYAARGGNPYR